MKVIVTTTDPGGVTRILADEPEPAELQVLSSPKTGRKP